MSHIKIVCPPPKKCAGSHGNLLFYPTLGGELKVLLVEDDGTERELGDSLESVEMKIVPGEAPSVTLKFLAPELDIAAVEDFSGINRFDVSAAELDKIEARSTEARKPIAAANRKPLDYWGRKP